MIQELKPLTISSSIRKNPTVLFTTELKQFLLYEPFNGENHIVAELYSFMMEHFKVELLRSGSFSLRGKKYLCCEEISGCIEVDSWLTYQWKKKRQFNRFIRPRALFDMYLFDMFFPVFGPSSKLIIPGKKDRFVAHAFPQKNKGSIAFEPRDINSVGLNDPAMRMFFKHIKLYLNEYLEDFIALNHEKFRADIKYRVSLYPDHRNQYWNELSKCFEPSFRNYITANIENYILNL